VTIHHNNEELLTEIRLCLVKALRAYKEANNVLPDRIIIYRDGVGDGDIQYVKEVSIFRSLYSSFFVLSNTIVTLFHFQQEIAAMKSVFQEFQISPKFTFIVVSKRINTRFFTTSIPGKPGNPHSGTVVDDVVTLPER
jgi:aubergine-like protein